MINPYLRREASHGETNNEAYVFPGVMGGAVGWIRIVKATGQMEIVGFCPLAILLQICVLHVSSEPKRGGRVATHFYVF